ncbi:MAG: Hpt domain-containing protein, partial [Leptospirillia bacterium]
MGDGFDNDEMKEIVQDFLQEATEMLEGLDNFFVQLENNPEDKTLLNEIFRTAHSIKGSAGFIGLTRIVEVAHHAENVLNQLRSGNMRAEPAVIDIILEAMDALKVLVNEVKTGEQADVDIEGINMKLDLLLQWGEDTGSAEGAKEEPAGEEMAAAVREEQAIDKAGGAAVSPADPPATAPEASPPLLPPASTTPP